MGNQFIIGLNDGDGFDPFNLGHAFQHDPEPMVETPFRGQVEEGHVVMSVTSRGMTRSMLLSVSCIYPRFVTTRVVVYLSIERQRNDLTQRYDMKSFEDPQRQTEPHFAFQRTVAALFHNLSRYKSSGLKAWVVFLVVGAVFGFRACSEIMCNPRFCRTEVFRLRKDLRGRSDSFLVDVARRRKV